MPWKSATCHGEFGSGGRPVACLRLRVRMAKREAEKREENVRPNERREKSKLKRENFIVFCPHCANSRSALS